MLLEQRLKEVVNRLVRKFNPNKIILFGSQARGSSNKYSDFDILVICPVSNGRRKLVIEMDRELYGLGLPRDIIVLTPEEYEEDQKVPGTVARPASLEGKVLYQSAT